VPDATFINGFAPWPATLPEQEATWENTRIFWEAREAVAALMSH
jgi:hypothetical protein